MNSQLNIFQRGISGKSKGVSNATKDLKREWWVWHHKNPEVFDRFEAKALELIGKGYKRYSSDGICHVIRWELNVKRNADDQFVINNNYTAYMASYFMYLYPEYKDFFETRVRKSARNREQGVSNKGQGVSNKYKVDQPLKQKPHWTR